MSFFCPWISRESGSFDEDSTLSFFRPHHLSMACLPVSVSFIHPDRKEQLDMREMGPAMHLGEQGWFRTVLLHVLLGILCDLLRRIGVVCSRVV